MRGRGRFGHPGGPHPPGGGPGPRGRVHGRGHGFFPGPPPGPVGGPPPHHPLAVPPPFSVFPGFGRPRGWRRYHRRLIAVRFVPPPRPYPGAPLPRELWTEEHPEQPGGYQGASRRFQVEIPSDCEEGVAIPILLDDMEFSIVAPASVADAVVVVVPESAFAGTGTGTGTGAAISGVATVITEDKGVGGAEHAYTATASYCERAFECPACTFHNPRGQTLCEICQFALPIAIATQIDK